MQPATNRARVFSGPFSPPRRADFADEGKEPRRRRSIRSCLEVARVELKENHHGVACAHGKPAQLERNLNRASNWSFHIEVKFTSCEGKQSAIQRRDETVAANRANASGPRFFGVLLEVRHPGEATAGRNVAVRQGDNSAVRSDDLAAVARPGNRSPTHGGARRHDGGAVEHPGLCQAEHPYGLFASSDRYEIVRTRFDRRRNVHLEIRDPVWCGKWPHNRTAILHQGRGPRLAIEQDVELERGKPAIGRDRLDRNLAWNCSRPVRCRRRSQRVPAKRLQSTRGSSA